MQPSVRLEAPRDVAREVLPEEYTRLLGYPPGRDLEGAALTLGAVSRDWYQRYGRPWVFARTLRISSLTDRTVELEDGTALESRVLARRLRRAEATALVVAAVSSGPEVDERVDRLWREERPDEAFFLDRFGVAVAEHLATWCAEVLRSPSAGPLAALPGFSPGYDGWHLSQQKRLHGLLVGDPNRQPPGPLQVLDSGMITPRSSLIAVFGLTERGALATASWARSRCSWCSLADCSLRRAPIGARGDSNTHSG